MHIYLDMEAGRASLRGFEGTLARPVLRKLLGIEGGVTGVGSPSFDQSFMPSGGEAVLRKIRNVVLRFERSLLDSTVESGIEEKYLQRISAASLRLPQRAALPRLPLYLHGTSNLVGCTMDLLSEWQSFAEHSHSWDAAKTTRALIELHAFISQCHEAKVVIGELSPHNFGFSGDSLWAIDVVAYQYPGLPCTTVYPGTVDPELLLQDEAVRDSDPHAYQLQKPYTPESDWYGFCCLVLQSLTGLSPWAGAHRLSDDAPELSLRRVRALRGLSVLDPSIRVGASLRPPESLREELYEYLYGVFTHGNRGSFPLALLRSIRWVRCPACGSEVSADFCPCGQKVQSN